MSKQELEREIFVTECMLDKANAALSTARQAEDAVKKAQYNDYSSTNEWVDIRQTVKLAVDRAYQRQALAAAAYREKRLALESFAD